LMYRDFDGDIVTVKFSKPIFTLPSSQSNLAKANDVFKFNTGTVDATTFNVADLNNMPMQQLELIDLVKAPLDSHVNNIAIGAGITITAVKAGSGNGKVDVGYIHAYEPAQTDGQGHTTVSEKQVPLGAVSIAGDLGQIDAGGSGAKL